MRAVALDLEAVLGDTGPLWDAWVEDASRRSREVLALPRERTAAAAALDVRLGNWRVLLERFAEERAPVYLRPRAAVNAALRSLRASDVRLGGFTDAPAELARVALAQLGAGRLLDLVKCGAGALELLLAELGPDTAVIRSREALLALATE